ncbi:MAG: lysine exporter LysO family protein [Muribaculaceae bacterium]|nr:lysine exporter LysO family protein [Muribaculaceae bacterium]MDE6754912.1 lysine exporter LysO family protein [Muribaculaceae bacterium]
MTTIFILFGFLILGFLLRKFEIPSVPPVVLTAIIWLLLLLMGISIGSNREIVENFATYGKEALIIGSLATLGSVSAALILSKSSKRK